MDVQGSLETNRLVNLLRAFSSTLTTRNADVYVVFSSVCFLISHALSNTGTHENPEQHDSHMDREFALTRQED